MIFSSQNIILIQIYVTIHKSFMQQGPGYLVQFRVLPWLIFMAEGNFKKRS